jgi:LmbE family N-acetylglucosaminyl deacetylase
MIESLPYEPKRVLAIGAHPDDVEFFAGATLVRLGRQGAHVALCVCTDGGRGGRGLDDAAGVRKDEQARAAEAIGAAEWSWLEHPDGALGPGDPLRGELVHEIRRVRPELVLAHDPRTLWTPVGGITHPGHSDHRAAGQAALDAIYPRSISPNFYAEQFAGEGALKPWYPREVWLFDTNQPDLRADVAEYFEVKLAALRAHASQEDVGAGGLLDAARAIGRHWGSGDRPAEAFVRLRLY